MSVYSTAAGYYSLLITKSASLISSFILILYFNASILFALPPKSNLPASTIKSHGEFDYAPNAPKAEYVFYTLAFQRRRG